MNDSFLFFFFQAEDGIRDADVTGVQTCALPIWRSRRGRPRPLTARGVEEIPRRSWVIAAFRTARRVPSVTATACPVTSFTRCPDAALADDRKLLADRVQRQHLAALRLRHPGAAAERRLPAAGPHRPGAGCGPLPA